MRSCSHTTMEVYKWWAEQLSAFLTQYKWFLDAYIIEFFTESHWSKLPASWRDSLNGIETKQASQLLLSNPFHHHRKVFTVDKVYPLSLLAFVATAHALAAPREPQHCRMEAGEGRCSAARGRVSKEPVRGQGSDERRKMVSQVAGLDHVFRRHVKPKKQHEIKHLAAEAVRLAGVTGCRKFIDIGSGQGHLARYLAYDCGLDVVTVDAEDCHLTAAAKFDSEVERDMVKKARKLRVPRPTDFSQVGSISHVESEIRPGISLQDLLTQLGLGTPLHEGSPPHHHLTHPHLTHPHLTPPHLTHPHLTHPHLTPPHLTHPHPTHPHPTHHRLTHPHLTHPHPSAPEDRPPTHDHYILVGLHTCGDLAPTILRLYVESRQVVGLISVGCCYMKLSCQGEAGHTSCAELKKPSGALKRGGDRISESDAVSGEFDTEGDSLVDGVSDDSHSKKTDAGSSSNSPTSSPATVWGYPMSEYLSKLRTQLNYEAREVACHSLEAYWERLEDSSHHVKVHCHRAVVETLLRKHGLRRCQVRIGRRISKLPFNDYAAAVLEGLGLPVSELETCSVQLSGLLVQWREVAVFFMLRLVLAQCVETALLLDRLLFLVENGLEAQLLPLFDPLLSPRNLVITSHK